MRRLRFHFTSPVASSSVAATPAPAPVVTAAEEIPEHAFDWSGAELDALSATSEEDLEDTRSWLRRLGFPEAVNFFDA